MLQIMSKIFEKSVESITAGNYMFKVKKKNTTCNSAYYQCFRHVKNLLTKIKAFKPTEAVAQTCSVKKMFLEISQNSQENTCPRFSSCEFCEVSKNTFFYRTPLVAASSLLYGSIHCIWLPWRKTANKNGKLL